MFSPSTAYSRRAVLSHHHFNELHSKRQQVLVELVVLDWPHFTRLERDSGHTTIVSVVFVGGIRICTLEVPWGVILRRQSL